MLIFYKNHKNNGLFHGCVYLKGQKFYQFHEAKIKIKLEGRKSQSSQWQLLEGSLRKKNILRLIA